MLATETITVDDVTFEPCVAHRADFALFAQVGQWACLIWRPRGRTNWKAAVSFDTSKNSLLIGSPGFRTPLSNKYCRELCWKLPESAAKAAVEIAKARQAAYKAREEEQQTQDRLRNLEARSQPIKFVVSHLLINPDGLTRLDLSDKEDRAVFRLRVLDAVNTFFDGAPISPDALHLVARLIAAEEIDAHEARVRQTS